MGSLFLVVAPFCDLKGSSIEIHPVFCVCVLFLCFFNGVESRKKEEPPPKVAVLHLASPESRHRVSEALAEIAQNIDKVRATPVADRLEAKWQETEKAHLAAGMNNWP